MKTDSTARGKSWSVPILPIFFVLFSWISSTEARVNVVGGVSPGNSGTINCNGNPQSNQNGYATVQAAVNASNSGDEIVICSGTYNEAVSITKNNLSLRSNTGLAADVKITNSAAPITHNNGRLTLKHLTLESSANNGLEGAWGGTGPYTLENLAVSAYNHGIHLSQSTSASSFKDLTVTSANGTGIYLEWNANGGHTLDGVTVTGKNYGIYAAQGLTSVTNVKATGQTETGIYSGDKFATSFTDVEAISMTGGRGIHIVNATNTSNTYTFSNVTATAGTSHGIHIQRSGKVTMSTINATGGTSGSGIFLDWDADGSHDFQNITASGGNYGIYLARGATILKNATATATTQSAIYLGNKYSATLDTITATASSGDRGIYIANSDGGTNTFSLTSVSVKSKSTGIDINRSGKLTLSAVTVESSNGMGIQFGYDADGAHDLSNIAIKSANIGLNAQRGLTKLADFSIETTANTGINTISRRDQTIQRGTIKSVGSGIVVGHDAEVKLTAEDFTIETSGQYGISLARSSSATIQRVCISGMTDSGIYTSWNAKNVTIRDSQFGNSGSNGGVYIDSDSSYKATVTNNGFLKSSTPRAKSNSTKHNFKGNFWQGVAGGTSYTDGNVKDSATLSANPVSSCYAPSTPKLVAEYRFDECTQYSNGAGQVLDNQGSYHATPQSGLQNGTPGQINRYADFSNGSRYTSVIGPNLNNWTLSVWFKKPFATSTNHSSRYYVIGSVGTQGDLLYLDRNSAGGAYQWGVYDQNGSTKPGTFRFSTLSDGWHHMAVVASGSTTSLYIDGSYVDQVSGKTSGRVSYLGASVDNAGSASGQSFGTPLDELKLFNYALSASDISSIYNNESSNKNWDGTARSNPCSALDHIRIEAGATGLTCQREAVTFKACADSTCTSLYPGGDAQLTLSPSGQWYSAASGGSALTNPQTIPIAGAVTLYLQQATASAVNVNTASAGGPVPTGTPAVTCNNDTTAAPCAITFTDAGLIFTADTNPGLEATIPTQIAGVDSGQLYVRAAKSDGTGQCVSAVNGGAATIGYACDDPSTCSSGNWLSTTGTLTFDSNGYAGPFRFNYTDVGKISLSASATASGGGSLTGTSNKFVVKPYGFIVRACTGTPPCTVDNNSATDGSGSVFAQAGMPFNVTISAVAKLGTITPGFGREIVPEGVSISHNRIAPAPGADGSLSGTTSVAGTAFQAGSTKGRANITDLSWDEVGVITLKAANANYLGNGLQDCTTETYGEVCKGTFGMSGYIGRFYPHHFSITGSVTNRSDLVSAGGSFTYMGEPLRLDLSVTAYNKGDGVTTNYMGAFAKLDAASLGTGTQWFTTGCTGSTQCFGLGAVNAATGLSGRLGVVGAGVYAGVLAPTSSWTAGVGTFVVNVRMNRKTLATDWPDPPTSVLDGPYDALRFGAMPRDSDGVTLPGPASIDAHKVDFDATTGDTLNSHPDGTHERRWLFDTGVRFGRLRLVPGQGSQHADYLLRTEAQYWNGSAWVTNTLDSLTPLAADNFAITGAGTIIDAGNIDQGFGSVRIRPSGTGVADVCLGAGAAGTGACAAANPAELDYLLGNWSDAAFDDDPGVRVTFGQPQQKSRANWGFIYRRENY
jgi:hypothetical protein